MYQALYRAYRPEVFSELLGQEHIIRILKNQIEKKQTGHAYLLCGTRGTGKTTTARILAKAVNCLSDGERPCGVCENCQSIKKGTFIDVIEIDAASNNGVENIRELRESVKYPPAAGNKKVYIIDEVHMLSSGAFNALLKTLEEPPEYVMFILATTEPEKLPQTILSRCMRLDFRRIPERILKDGMKKICHDRNIDVTDAALGLIAANADGSVRDGLSILDQCLSAGASYIDRDHVLDFLGASSEEVFIQLTHNVACHNTSEALVLLNTVLAEGKEVRQFMKDWLSHYRALLISKFVQNPEDMLNMSSENVARLKAQADTLEVAEINRAVMELSRAISEGKWSTQPRIILEIAIVKLSSSYDDIPVRRAAEPAASKEPVKTEKREEPAVPVQVSGESRDYDCDMIWRAVSDAAGNVKKNLNLVRTLSKLKEISENTFTVVAGSAFIQKLITDNSQLFEQLMEQHTGKKHALVCRLEDEKIESENNIEEVVKEAENILGLNIEIK